MQPPHSIFNHNCHVCHTDGIRMICPESRFKVWYDSFLCLTLRIAARRLRANIGTISKCLWDRDLLLPVALPLVPCNPLQHTATYCNTLQSQNACGTELCSNWSHFSWCHVCVIVGVRVRVCACACVYVSVCFVGPRSAPTRGTSSGIMWNPFAVCCRVLQRHFLFCYVESFRSVLQCAAECCRVLQRHFL